MRGAIASYLIKLFQINLASHIRTIDIYIIYRYMGWAELLCESKIQVKMRDAAYILRKIIMKAKKITTLRKLED